MLSFEVLLAFNVIIWLVAIYILIRIISAARSNSKKSRRIEQHSSLSETKCRLRKKRPNFLTKLIPFSSERRNSATQGLVEFKVGLYGTGNFEKNRDRESPGPEKPGPGTGTRILAGTGTVNREKSGIFRNNFFTQKFYYSNYFLKKSVQFSNYFILELDLFFWIKKTENF